MELACVLVLTIVSLVTATPHGYGVKGGAAARADASATSGTFGGYGEIPLSIPSGGSYSGSYSKSSSSSFASSSASSSSSSFNLNGGVLGSGRYGQPGTKCTSGACQTGSLEGAGGPGSYSGANAAASAGAGAIVSPGYGYNTACTSGNCLKNKPACEGSNCDSGSDKKCTSSDCTNDQPGTSNVYGTNDIPVFVAGAGSKSSSDKTSASDKTSSGSGCTYGNCGTTSELKPSSPFVSGTYSTTTNNKPLTTLTAPKHEEPCTSPNCESLISNSYDSGKPSSYNVPINSDSHSNSIPNTRCTTGICGNVKTDVPHSSISPNEPVIGTGNTIKSPNHYQGDLPDFVPLAPSGSSSNPSSIAVSSPAKYPSYPNVPTGPVSSGDKTIPVAFGATKPSSYIIPTTQKQPQYTGGFGGPPGILKPNEHNAPSKVPGSNFKPPAPVDSGDSISCTSGNCGSQPGSKPVACTFGNCGSQPSQSKPLYGQNGSYKPTGPSGSFPFTPSGSSSPSGCSSGNCGSQHVQPLPVQPSYGYKPTAPANSGSYNPVSSAGSYSQTGSSKPTSCSTGNCGSQTIQSLPSFDSYESTGPASSGSYNPVASSGSYSPTGCSSGNCVSQPSQPQYPGSYKPITGSGSFNPQGLPSFNNPAGCTSGNCDSQPGQSQNTLTDSYKPIEPSGPGGYSPQKPSGPYNPIQCSGNCGSKPVQSSPQFIQSGFNKPTAAPSGPVALETYKPSLGPSGTHGGAQVGQTSPQYGQSDSFKPTPLPGSYYPSAPAGSYSPTGCSSGDCGSQPTGTYNPTFPSGSGCVSGNCHSQSGQSSTGSYKPSDSTSSSSYYPLGSTPQVGSSGPSYKPIKPSGSYSPASCISGNCGTQPDQLKPHHEHKPAGPTGSYNQPCTFGNCGSSYEQSSVQFGQSGSQYKPITGSANNGQYKPIASTGHYNSVTCSSGTCGTQSTQISQNSSPSGSQHKPALPTFGGPSGILKPNEFNTPANIPTSNFKPTAPVNHAGINSGSSLGSNSPSSCPFGNCGSQSGHSLAGQNSAVAGAAASANAVAYTGGFGGPPGLLKPFDDGKLTAPSSADGKGPHIGSTVGTSPGTGIHSSYGKSLTGDGDVNAGNSAKASAVAGATAGTYGGGNNHGGDNHVAGGCKGGCGNDAGGFGHNAAIAKSAANAVSNASTGAYSGSFASSSASAHASSGAATKGGYGKR